MIKKLLTALLMLVVITGANAQIMQQQKDTLRVTTMDNKLHDFILYGDKYESVNFSSDYTTMVFRDDWYDTETVFDLKNVKSVRFYNRFSNPQVLLKAQGSGVYDGLFQLSAWPEQMFYFISCLASDEMFGGGGLQDMQVKEYDLLTHGLNRGSLNTAWDVYYQAIYNANAAIVHLQNLPPEVSSAEQHHALGETLFMRAFYYYELASLFGAVPIITDNNSWVQKMTSPTPAQVWGQILYDLKTAIAEMNVSSSADMDDSRVGKYAAEAMLARAYLFYTGFYLGAHDMAQTAEANVDLPDGTRLTKQDVIACVEDCVNNSGFKLVPDYRNLWPYTNRITREDYSYTKGQNLAWVEDDGAVNPEVLFKIKYNKNASWNYTNGIGYSNQIALYLGMRGQTLENTGPFGQGWGYGTVAPNLYDDWNTAEPQDMRRDASIQDVEQLPAYRYGGWSGKDYAQETRYHEKKLSPIFYRNSKYGEIPFEVEMYGEDGWQNYISFQTTNIHPLNLIRFADVLLMHSELTGTVDGINQVRARAGLAPLVGYSLEALQQERRWELAFEGVRWNDMRRFGDDYCKAALDAQMNQPIYNSGKAAKNPIGLDVYDADPRPYSAHYAENRGFFEIPEAYQQVGALLIKKMQGAWTYDEGATVLIPDYVSINGTLATRYDPAGKEVAKGNFIITPTDNYDQRICQITFTNGSMLPMSKKYSDNDGTVTFNLISLSDDQMLLEADGKELKLCRDYYTDYCQIHGVKWSYGTYTANDWNTGADVTFGTFGLYSFEEPYYSQHLPEIDGLYLPYIKGTTAEDLSAFVKDNNMIVAEGEADPFAYMVFDFYEYTIKKYTADGKLINSGTFTLEVDEETGNIIIHTSENATLVPYRYNGQSEIIRDFKLMVRTYETALADWSSPLLGLMTTSMNDDMNTYWMFGKRGLTSEEFDKVLAIQQQEKDGTPSATGRFLSINIDRDRFRIYVEDVETGEDITVVNNNSPFMIKVAFGQTVTKKLRFRLKNCNNIDAVVERTLTLTNPDPPVRFYIYGGPDNPEDKPFVPGTWDAAAMRFSSTDGMYLPTLSDEVYFGHKTLIFDVSDVTDNFDMKVMNGWWSNTYYDHVKWVDGLNELQITETMAKECAKGGEGRDLDLLLYSGSMTLKAVFYEE